jgi:HTH-type transcriptional regulator, sugar sensing transcriptional regulator
MIVDEAFLTKLKDFGLNSYESKLWIALLSRGVSTTGELSDIANVPRSRSYDVLESLEKKGFVVQKIGKPIKYVAIPPSEVLERVKKGVEDDAQSQIKILSELETSSILGELTLLHNQGIELVEPTEFTSAIKGRSNLYNHLQSSIKNAKKEIIIATSTNGFARKVLAFKSTLKKLSQKGVKIKILAPLSQETKKYEEELKGIAEVRHSLNIRARVCIVDGCEATFMIMDDSSVHPSYDVGIWINSPYFANTLRQFFEAIWLMPEIKN